MPTPHLVPPTKDQMFRWKAKMQALRYDEPQVRVYNASERQTKDVNASSRTLRAVTDKAQCH
jgi:hypothetical protein